MRMQFEVLITSGNDWQKFECLPRSCCKPPGISAKANRDGLQATKDSELQSFIGEGNRWCDPGQLASPVKGDIGGAACSKQIRESRAESVSSVSQICWLAEHFRWSVPGRRTCHKSNVALCAGSLANAHAVQALSLRCPCAPLESLGATAWMLTFEIEKSVWSVTTLTNETVTYLLV